MDNRLAESRNFLELNGLNTIRLDAKSGTDEEKKAALKEAAQQFEAIFMQMLLKSMRKAQEVLESDSPFNSESTKFYRDMHDQQMAMELSSNGSLGLSDLIIRQLGGDDNFTPNSVLRSDGDLESRKSFAKSYALNNQTKFDDLQQYKEQSFSQNSPPFNATNIDLINNMGLTSNNRQSSTLTVTTSSQEKFKQPKDFVTALIEPAKSVENKLGIPFEVVIAQAALETGWGQKIIKSEQGESSNNLFNIKADNRWQGSKITKDTLEFEQGSLVKKSALFRSYESIKDSVKDYINFLSSGDRYQNALDNVGNVEHFLHGLQKAGYATDPNYANKIMATLRTVKNLVNQN
ncbi:MAG: flagellar assembly peptidoglycan hydrolase FlgJ [Colwellia sp.]|nr:flagellar assembly peptidoglycan hydrolase FlgJ [Colwellia sp.]